MAEAGVAQFLRGPDRVGRLMALSATSVPPQLFFWLLIFAGFGIPVSEDLLCIYAGAILPQLPVGRRLETVVALYAGVIVSDWITYLIGRLAGDVLLQAQRRPAGRRKKKFAEEEDEAPCDTSLPTKVERAQQLVRRSGRQVGFALRLAVGLRVPMLLLSGWGRVPFLRAFLPYNLLGGAVSLSVQLTLGAVAFRASPQRCVSSGLATFLPCLMILAVLLCFSAAALQRFLKGGERQSTGEVNQKTV